MRCALALVCLLPLACSKAEPPSPAARGPRAGLREPRVPAYFKSQAAANEAVEPTEAASQPAAEPAVAAASRPASAPAPAAAADAERAAPADPEVFDNAFAGVRIRKPKGWRFMTAPEVQRAREAMRDSSNALAGAGLALAPPPLVSITRYPADRAGFSPSIVVTSRVVPDGDLAPKELMEMLLPSLTAGFPGVTQAQAPAVTKVGGKDAAEARVRYAAGASKTPVETRLVMVRRGSTLLVFALTGAAKGPDRCDAELKAALGSVEIR
ncbi:MAG TPA: hypothetical protein VGQ83_11275 [Polyangia bacterium]|jgi:hypothetical protein